MMRDGKISFVQLFFLIMMSSGFYNHVILTPPVLNVARRDAWISASLTGVSFSVVLLIIYVIHKLTGDQSVFEYLQEGFGKVGKWVFAIPLLIYLMISGYITFFDTISWTKVSYLQKTPQIFLALMILAVIVLMLKEGMETLAIAAGVLLPMVVILGIFVTIANVQNKNYSLLFPILTEGWDPVWGGFLVGSSGAMDLVLLLCIQHQVKKKMALWKYVVIGAMLLNLFLAPLTGTIALFGPEHGAELRYPAYEQWRMVSIGSYIKHVDYLTIYQWLSGAVIRIALILYLIPLIFTIKQVKVKRKLHLGYVVLLVSSLYVPLSDMQFYEWLKKYVLPGFTYGMGLYLFLLLGAVVWIHRRRTS
ncbi:GerAB/ArcD/ProY family transporter [Salimicrobium halophilum]|uniref:Spore germination protein (Amino acid permease) n=1 Tax=Salimicrobium halophilum TaxID=86666 RepID=A0A1G8QXM4_9BACI|nr:endospore germination permease [Salimicrobium halophilum]SDJ09466.1 spore germination protein (amino acid permease) [Salimicrobium halophilum]